MEVECKYSRSDSTKHFYNTCVVSKAYITGVQTEIKKFKGKHEDNVNGNYVESIRFEKTVVKYIPKGIINAFPNLTTLYIDECGLKSISRADLSEFDNLEEINITSNKLKSLPSDLFIGKSKLKWISFFDNELEFVSSLLLKPLLENPLTYVDLRSNPSIDEYYHAYGDHGCASIEALMAVIDKQCSRPFEDNCGFTDETFDGKLKSNSTVLWTTGLFSDFTIIAGGLSTKEEMKEFRVHKNVLGSQSSVFAAMFKNDMEESKTGRMKILDFSAGAVEQFLCFLYTGSVSDNINAMELFALAAKYDVPNLKHLSEKTVLTNVDEESALDIFNLGYLYSSDSLKQSAFRSIQEMFPGKEMSQALMNDPEGFKELIDASGTCQIKKKKAENELEEALITRNTKLQEYEKKLNAVWNKVNKLETPN